MRQVSLVGAVDEEVGDYFPEFISMLQESPFLEVSVFILFLFYYVCVYKQPYSQWMCECLSLFPVYGCESLCNSEVSHPVFMQRTLPWGTFSSLRLQSPTESDDGPIMWVRPGEQMIPMADMPKSPFKRKRWVDILSL